MATRLTGDGEAASLGLNSEGDQNVLTPSTHCRGCAYSCPEITQALHLRAIDRYSQCEFDHGLP